MSSNNFRFQLKVILSYTLRITALYVGHNLKILDQMDPKNPLNKFDEVMS